MSAGTKALTKMGSNAATGAAVGSQFAPGIGTLAGGIVGGLYGAVTGWWQGDQEDVLRGRQLRIERDALREQMRRLDTQNAQTMGQAELAAAASGVSLQSGSLQRYLAQLGSEFKRESEWARTAGESQIGVMAQGYKAEDVAAYWSALSDIGKAVNQYGKNNNYFQKPEE